MSNFNPLAALGPAGAIVTAGAMDLGAGQSLSIEAFDPELNFDEALL
jgi:hypothetical protein